jgi:hypothetical protein
MSLFWADLRFICNPAEIINGWFVATGYVQSIYEFHYYPNPIR